MLSGARRLLFRDLTGAMRRALMAVCLFPASMAGAQGISSAHYDAPTTRYAHGILGDAIEHGQLVLRLTGGREVSITLPQSDVFEDTQPRLADVDLDGDFEVIVVQSNNRLGAKLAIYDETGLIADTPNIGRSNRWLSPLGAADLDGDGKIEIAYIDRPHLAKILRIWRFVDGALVSVGDLGGYTNHRIGERDIAGGIRTCNGKPEMIVATANWSELKAITFEDDGFSARRIGRDSSRPAFAAAMKCAP